jgi:hypothetical protein
MAQKDKGTRGVVTEFAKQDWTIETVKDHVLAVMDERDKRYEQRFQASQKAIDEAKAESQKKFEGTNEWRGMVSDAQKNFVTRKEVEPINEQLNKCVTWPAVFAIVSATGVIIGVGIEILNFALFQHK